jgi:site-specific recombinase XerD
MQKRGESFDFERFEKSSISSINLDDVRAVAPELIIEYLMFAGFERKNSPSTRMRKLSALKSFFHYAYVKKHFIDSNPTSDIDAPKKNKTLPKYLTVEEAVSLLTAIKSDTE